MRQHEPRRDQPELRYLCVDDFMRDLVGARALASALELGLIDALEQGASTTDALAARTRLDARGLELLLGLLCSNGVVNAGVTDARDARVSLTEGFRTALKYRDLLAAKLDFAALVAPDFMGLFTTLLTEPAAFFEKARVFELFSYQRCFEPTPENRAATARWVRFTTALTRYEAGACIARHDFSRYRSMLDVGGNSGEFALQVCRRHPALRATVYDLPVVCDIGAEHLRAEPEAARIRFERVRRAAPAMPAGFDLVTFKSMLHDWPEAEMRGFLAEAHRSLEPGGTVLIFERRRFDALNRPAAYSMVPLLLFFRFYREARDYREPLERAGFRDVALDEIELDMPFILVRATK